MTTDEERVQELEKHLATVSLAIQRWMDGTAATLETLAESVTTWYEANEDRALEVFRRAGKPEIIEALEYIRASVRGEKVE